MYVRKRENYWKTHISKNLWNVNIISFCMYLGLCCFFPFWLETNLIVYNKRCFILNRGFYGQIMFSTPPWARVSEQTSIFAWSSSAHLNSAALGCVSKEAVPPFPGNAIFLSAAAAISRTISRRLLTAPENVATDSRRWRDGVTHSNKPTLKTHQSVTAPQCDKPREASSQRVTLWRIRSPGIGRDPICPRRLCCCCCFGFRVC